jgi:phosphoribosylaminoimidazole-succinocarboxamide synthase
MEPRFRRPPSRSTPPPGTTRRRRATYEAGHGQPSFDKQFVRDWLVSAGWDKTPPAPVLPPDVIASTSEKYIQAYELITGRAFVPERG